MQYILTEEEYKNFVPLSAYERECKKIEELNKLVLKLAKFTCIHERTQEQKEYYGCNHYCDDCPIAWKIDSCKKRKYFSK